MSISTEIQEKKIELAILQEMHGTNFNTMLKDTLFRTSDYLQTLARGEGSLKYFAGLNSNFVPTFYKGGRTSASNVEGEDLVPYSYCVAVATDEAAKETAFRKWVLANVTAIGDLKFPMSDFPARLPRNYLTIIEEEKII